MITSLYVHPPVGGYVTIVVRWEGRTVGALTVEEGDSVRMIYALRPNTVEPEEVRRRVMRARRGRALGG